MTHAYAHAHFSNKRVIRELRIVSCLGGGVWVAVTREFERDNCVISEILQSDWTIPNRAGVRLKSPDRLSACGRGGLGTRLSCVCVCVCVCVQASHPLLTQLQDQVDIPMDSVSCSLQNKFGVFRIMVEVAISLGSRPFLYAHFPRDLTHAVNLYAHV